VQLGFVDQLRRISPEHVHPIEPLHRQVFVRRFELQIPGKPLRRRGDALEHERKSLRDGVVAEASQRKRQRCIAVREVLGMAPLVQHRLVVILAALGISDQIDLVRNARRRAERPWRFRRPRLHVEDDVLLCVVIEPQGRHRRAIDVEQPFRREVRVELGCPEEKRDIAFLRGGRLDADPLQPSCQLASVPTFGLTQEAPADLG
jgi:hypothetical protein